MLLITAMIATLLTQNFLTDRLVRLSFAIEFTKKKKKPVRKSWSR